MRIVDTETARDPPIFVVKVATGIYDSASAAFTGSV
jgi:hypothetical protein